MTDYSKIRKEQFFRKKPVVVEAWLWDGDCDWRKAPEWAQAVVPHWSPNRTAIQTLEGLVWATPGDWFIKGIKGEVYPCKPDIFAATYDALTRIEQAEKEA